MKFVPGFNKVVSVTERRNILKIFDLSSFSETAEMEADGEVKDLIILSDKFMGALRADSVLIYTFNKAAMAPSKRKYVIKETTEPYIKIFPVKPGQFGVLTLSNVFVLDFKCNLISTVNTRLFQGSESISNLVALNDGRFASAYDDQIGIFDFTFENHELKRRKTVQIKEENNFN